MMPTGDEAPRKDGLYPHRGTWGEVTVGTMIADQKGNPWKVIATKHPPQVEFGHTLWFRIVNPQGEEASLPPRMVTAPVIILTLSPADIKTAPPTRPVDTDAIQAVIEGLGATLLATINNETGEVTCPSYIFDSHIPGPGNNRMSRGLLEHLQIAHGFDPNVLSPTWTYADIFQTHNNFHHANREGYGTGMFPHRHVEERAGILF